MLYVISAQESFCRKAVLSDSGKTCNIITGLLAATPWGLFFSFSHLPFWYYLAQLTTSSDSILSFSGCFSHVILALFWFSSSSDNAFVLHSTASLPPPPHHPTHILKMCFYRYFLTFLFFSPCTLFQGDC